MLDITAEIIQLWSTKLSIITLPLRQLFKTESNLFLWHMM